MKGKFLGKVLALSLVMATAFATVVWATAPVEAAKTFTYGHVTGEQAGYIKTVFRAEEYAKMYPDVVDAGFSTPDQLWAHFINCGIWEHRQPSYGFQIDCFASSNTDLQPLYGPDIPSYYVFYAQNYAYMYQRSIPTWAGQGRVGNTVYAVEDFVVGQKGPRAGAIPVQTPGTWKVYQEKVLKDTGRDTKL